MANKYKMFLLSQDDSIQVKEVQDYVTVFELGNAPESWGSSLFGGIGILGSGLMTTTRTGIRKDLLSQDMGIYVVRRPVFALISTVSTPPSRWGAARFGTTSILGTGSLNIVEA